MADLQTIDEKVTCERIKELQRNKADLEQRLKVAEQFLHNAKQASINQND